MMMHSKTRTQVAEPAPDLRRVALAIALAATVAWPAARAMAQRGRAEPTSLRGSKASVERMYDFAQRHRYPFYLTPTNVDYAAARGQLVPLDGDSTYELTRGVGFSYATREAKQFITQFAPQYLARCGTPLTVTSAARPLSRQPRNANPHSVHPTGIAVDLRRPPPGPCLQWVRGALAELESRGVIEATEEHHPVHLHIAVLAAPGARVKLPDLTDGVVVARAAAPSPSVASVSPNVASVVVARSSKPRAGLPIPLQPSPPNVWMTANGDVALWPASLGVAAPHR